MPDLSDGTWSEIDANNNAAPPNGWPEGMMPSGVNDAARADRGALKRFWNKMNPLQAISSSGGIYTFITDNVAYPTAYVTGEVYWFRAHSASVGGDQFQVNALGPKPIYKEIGIAGGVTNGPIGPLDIGGGPVQLVYNGGLNAGIGAFMLVSPFVPIQGDGTGTGVNIPGSLTVSSGTNPGTLIINRDSGAVRSTGLAAIRTIGAPNEQPQWLNDTYGGPGSIIALRHANGSNAAPTPMVATNVLGAFAFRGWDSVGGTDFTAGAARIIASATESWNPTAHGTQLEIDTCNNGSPTLSLQAVIGPGLTVGAPTAPSGGMLVGDINAQRVFSNGQLVIGQDGSGNANISGNASIGGTLGVTGVTTLGSDLNVTGTSTLGAVISGNQIQAENLRSVGDSYIGGTLYANTGVVQAENLRSLGDSYIGNNLYVTGLINGHPAAVFDTLTAQVESLTARVANLESEIADLRRAVLPLGA